MATIIGVGTAAHFPDDQHSFVPWSRVPILGMVIQPLIGNPYNGYINPYYWVDDHPLLYGNIGSLPHFPELSTDWDDQLRSLSDA